MTPCDWERYGWNAERGVLDGSVGRVDDGLESVENGPVSREHDVGREFRFKGGGARCRRVEFGIDGHGQCVPKPAANTFVDLCLRFEVRVLRCFP